MTTRRIRSAVALSVIAALASVAFLATGGAGAKNVSANALPRSSTLYTAGTQWGPFASFNPLRSGYATGTLGLLYETLLRYDPLKGTFIPWLATDGKWVGKSYVVTLRNGVKWNDGKPFTAADVKFTFETGKLEGSAELHHVEDRADEHHHEGQRRQLQLQGSPELPGLGHQYVQHSDRAQAHLVKLQRDRHHHGQHG